MIKDEENMNDIGYYHCLVCNRKVAYSYLELSCVSDHIRDDMLSCCGQYMFLQRIENFNILETIKK